MSAENPFNTLFAIAPTFISTFLTEFQPKIDNNK